MKKLWYRILLLWYRLLGSSDVQAEWKARRACEAPDEAQREIQFELRRANDARFFCVCGQMLTAGDKECVSCGRRVYLPFWVRRFGRVMRSLFPGDLPGTTIVSVLIGLGFLVQLRYGTGSVMNPNDTAGLFYLGASFPSLTSGPQPWRAITYTFLHGGLMHIGFNVFVLLQIGPLIERTFGTGRFLAAWAVTGALAALLPIWITGGNLIIGASGAVFGLMGMALIYGHSVGTSQGKEIRDVMIRWTIYTTIFGFMMGGVAHSAHFAGLAAGIAFGYLAPPPEGRAERKILSPWFGAAGLLLILAALGGWGAWASGDALPPASLAPNESVRLFVTLAHSRGAEPYVGEQGRKLIEDARAARRANRARQEERNISIRLEQLEGQMSVGQQVLLRRAVIRALYPGGIPETPK